MNYLYYLLITIFSYLIGSISTAILIGKIKENDDIRTHGSGNAGATNILRTYGKFAAFLTVIGDCLKASISCIFAIIIAKNTSLGADNLKTAVYISGVACVIGHNFPVFFNFKGGKGIVVSITAYMFADWKIALPILILSLLLICITKYVSLGSVVGAIAFIVCGLIFKRDEVAYIIFTIITSGLAIIRHRENIKRLFSGTERKITDKK